MRKLFILALLPLTLACAQVSGPINDLGGKVGSTASNVATDSAAVLGKAVELDLPGLIRTAGVAVANLVKGVAEIVASPVQSAQDVVVDVVAPAEEAPAE